MTRAEATEILLDAGWLGIMCRELSDTKLIEAARKALGESEMTDKAPEFIWAIDKIEGWMV